MEEILPVEEALLRAKKAVLSIPIEYDKQVMKNVGLEEHRIEMNDNNFSLMGL